MFEDKRITGEEVEATWMEQLRESLGIGRDRMVKACRLCAWCWQCRHTVT